MKWFKQSPRCETGDVVQSSDKYGQHIQCLQCGYMKDIDGRYAVASLLRMPAVQDFFSLPIGSVEGTYQPTAASSSG